MVALKQPVVINFNVPHLIYTAIAMSEHCHTCQVLWIVQNLHTLSIIFQVFRPIEQSQRFCSSLTDIFQTLSFKFI